MAEMLLTADDSLLDWAGRYSQGRSVQVKALAVYVCTAMVFLNGVCAQEAASPALENGAGAKKISLIPRVSVTETLTDNVRLTSVGRQSEMVTEVSPGIRIAQSSGRVTGLLDYSVNARAYANGSAAGNIQQDLSAQALAELVDRRAFVDLGARINQQAISATGAQATASGLLNSNLSETTSLRVAPYVKGTFGGGVDYESRYSLAGSRSNGVASAESINRDFSLTVNRQPSGGRLGWSAGVNLNSNSFAGGRTTESDSFFAGANYSIVPQLVANASLGQEYANLSTAAKVSNWTNSIGLSWTPSLQTSVSFNHSTRSFGQTHSFGLSHRTGKTAWQYSDNQDLTTTPGQLSYGSLGNVYDLYFAQFASLEPDPTKRTALVEAYLQTNGINPRSTVVGGFLTSAVAIQRRQNLSVALLGVRSTVTVLASRSAASRMDTVSTAIDDLANGSLVEQFGLSVNLGHRLSPESDVNLMVSSQRSTSTGIAQDSASYQTSVGISTRVGLRATASFNARRAVFEGSTVPYQENAISGTLSVQF